MCGPKMHQKYTIQFNEKAKQRQYTINMQQMEISVTQVQPVLGF